MSTHSHIVVSRLAAHGDVIHIEMSNKLKDKPPTSTALPVAAEPSARLGVLRELGYDFDDFQLWSAWLVLEESSAERVINELLVPMFVPTLQGKLRTVSARSLGRVNATFDDLSSMLLFLHLQPQYRNRTWVVVDAGEQEKQTIDSLIQRYNASGWNADQFLQWSKHDFEEYYPPAFRQDFLTAKATNNNQELRSHKTRILMELLNSAKQNPETVKQELATSAQEVIELLHKVSVAISN